MARKFVLLTVLLLVAGIAFFAATFLMRTDEEKIRRRFAAAEKILEKKPDDGPIVIRKKMQQFLGLLSETCSFHTSVLDSSVQLQRNDLAQALGRVHLLYSRLSVEFLDIEIALEGERKAAARLTMRVASQEANSEETTETDYAVECNLVKPKRGWLLEGGSLAPKPRE